MATELKPKTQDREKETDELCSHLYEQVSSSLSLVWRRIQKGSVRWKGERILEPIFASVFPDNYLNKAASLCCFFTISMNHFISCPWICITHILSLDYASLPKADSHTWKMHLFIWRMIHHQYKHKQLLLLHRLFFLLLTLCHWDNVYREHHSHLSPTELLQKRGKIRTNPKNKSNKMLDTHVSSWPPRSFPAKLLYNPT